VEEIQAIEEATSEEEFELVNQAKGSKFSTPCALLEAKCVST